MNTPAPPDTILSPSCLKVAAVTWEIEYLIREAQITEQDPGNGPPNRLFFPSSVRSQVLVWGHTSRFACHPGVGRTLSLLKRHFWWPAMDADTRAFVLACTVCARAKSSHQPPAGLLRPLPVPGRPWSHIGLDFVTGLSPSRGHTVILTVVDRFLKAVHFIALPKLPTATRLLSCLCSMSFASTGFPLTLSLTLAPNSFSKCGRPSAECWGPPSACHQGTSCRLMDRLRELIRTSELRCVVWLRATPLRVATISLGSSMPTIPCHVQPLACPRLNVPWGSSQPRFLLRR